MSTVLITGAAGRYGTILRRQWGDRYALRLADLVPIRDLATHEQFVSVNIAEQDQMLAACQDIDVVVHLAADGSPAAEFYETLLPLNVIGAYNAFQAANEAGCRRIVFASSGQSMLGYMERESDVRWDRPVYPQNVYGATKCWGEALARVYADQGLSCICVRLGNPRDIREGEVDPDELCVALSHRDAAQLFGRCIDVEDVPFAIVHGFSRHRRNFLDIEDTCALLDYEPQDGTAFL